MILFANRLLNIRLFSVFLVFLCYYFFEFSQFENIVVCLGLAHYPVAAWSSRKHLVAATKSKSQIATYLGVLGLWTYFAISKIPGAFLSFYVHHVMGEISPFNSKNKAAENTVLNNLIKPRSFYYFLGFFIAFRYERPVRLLWSWCPIWPFVAFFALSGLWLAHSILRKPERELKISQIFSDSLLVLLVVASFYFRMNIKWLVLYHIAIWTFIPSIYLSAKDSFKHVYAPMIVLFTAIMIIAPRLLAYWNMQNSTLLWNFTYWGHLHHGVTLVLFLKTRTLNLFQTQPGIVMDFPAVLANEINSGTG